MCKPFLSHLKISSVVKLKAEYKNSAYGSNIRQLFILCKTDVLIKHRTIRTTGGVKL